MDGPSEKMASEQTTPIRVVTGDGQRLSGSNRENLVDLLAEANHLLAYAVEAGIEVDQTIFQRIIGATQQGEAFWNSPQSDVSDLLSACTKLAARLHPVT